MKNSDTSHASFFISMKLSVHEYKVVATIGVCPGTHKVQLRWGVILKGELAMPASSLVPRPLRGGEKKAWCTLFAHACN